MAQTEGIYCSSFERPCRTALDKSWEGGHFRPLKVYKNSNWSLSHLYSQKYIVYMNPYPLCNFFKNRWFLNPAKAQVKVKNVTTDDSVFVVECFPQDCNLGTERPARFGFMGMFTESMQARLVNSCEFDLLQIWIKLSLNKKYYYRVFLNWIYLS